MHDALEDLKAHILNASDRVFEIQSALCAIPALGPENGGQGELPRTRLVSQWLHEMGVDGQIRVDSPDPRVESGIRPNLVARIEGKSPQTLWLFSHLDVVPPGDLSAWVSDPWLARREGDLVYGRGVEDNQQAAASMLILARCLQALRIQPELSLGLVFMADEECGSRHGLAHILREKGELFKASDYFIVPDGGSPDGAAIEIAEKAQLWLRFEVIGKQCHASMPLDGKNAFVIASHLVCALGALDQIFDIVNPLFTPPVSTFTPSCHEANSPSINVLPGKDIFHMDCRLLPGLDPERVLKEVNNLSSRIATEYGADIIVDIAHLQQSTSTSPNSPAMSALRSAIASVYGVESRPVGIGGATVAAFLRQKNLPALVWSRIANTCHQPNECSSLSASCGDAAVFAEILMRPGACPNA